MPLSLLDDWSWLLDCGVVLATVARAISTRKGVRTGIHFLSEAIEPVAFMEELRQAGVLQTETLEFSAC